MSRTKNETGTVTAFVTCLTVALLAVAGLVIDGGYTLAARRRLFNEANAAARAGAQAADEGALRAGALRIDPVEARRRALKHLHDAGLDGHVVATANNVTVHAVSSQPVAVLGVVGVGPLTIHATGVARPLRGVTTPDG